MRQPEERWVSTLLARTCAAALALIYIFAGQDDDLASHCLRSDLMAWAFLCAAGITWLSFPIWEIPQHASLARDLREVAFAVTLATIVMSGPLALTVFAGLTGAVVPLLMVPWTGLVDLGGGPAAI